MTNFMHVNKIQQQRKDSIVTKFSIQHKSDLYDELNRNSNAP